MLLPITTINSNYGQSLPIQQQYRYIIIYTAPKKTSPFEPFHFWNNSVTNKPISIIFGAWTPEET